MNSSDPLTDPVENALTDAADDLRASLGSEIPPFSPNRSASPMVGVVAAAILAIGGFWTWSALQADDVTRVDTAVPIETTSPEPAEDSAPTSEQESEPTALSQLPTDLDLRELEPLERPAVGESVIDPAFGSTITRVTDAVGDEKYVPINAPSSAWNADGTLILLYTSGGDRGTRYIVFDALSFEEVAELDITPNDIEQVFWDPTDPDSLLFTDANAIRSVSVSTGSVREVATFDECALVTAPDGSGGPAWDGSLIVATCIGGDDARSVVAFEPSTGAISTLPLPDVGGGQAAPSGDAVVVDDSSGFTVYPPALDEAVARIAWEASGSLLTANTDGTTLIVGSGYEADFPGAIVTATLDGQVTVIVGPDTGYPFPLSGTRVSATMWGEPGLIVAASPTPSDGIQAATEGEIIVADVRGDTTVVSRVAHTRTSGSDYFSGVFVSISPSGDQILFSSDWGGGPTNTYVIDIA